MSILSNMDYISRMSQQGYQRGQQNKLAQITSEAFGAPQAQQQALVREAMATDPQFGSGLHNTLEGQNDKLAQSAANAARYLIQAHESKNPVAVQGAYAATRPLWEQFAKMKGADRPIPEQFDEAMMPFMHEIVAASGGANGASGASVHSQRVGADGYIYNTMRDGSMVNTGIKADPRYQARDYGDRDVVFDPRTGTLREAGAPMPAQGAPNAPAAIPSANAPTQVTTGAGEVIDLSGVDDPALRAQIAANPDYFNSLSDQAHEAPASAPQQPFMPQGIVQPPTYQAPRKGMSPAQQAQQAQQAEANRRAQEAAERAARAEQRAIAAQSIGSIPQGYRMVNGKLEPIPGAPNAVSGKPPTDGERAASGFLDRMVAAEQELGAVVRAGYNPGNLRDHWTAGQGALVNWAASPEGQKYRQAQEDWVRSKLRKESGAVIGDDEMEREIKVYFPQPGDSQAVIKQKEKSRQQALQQMRTMAGRATSAPSNTSAGGWGIRRKD